MSQEGNRRRKRAHLFEIVIVPLEEGKKAHTYHASRARLVLLAAGAAVLVIALTLAVLMYTPVALYVPIPNPELEARYGRMIRETQERLNALAQSVVLLRDYNQQLRKALGEGGSRDSSSSKSQPVYSARGDSVETLPVYTEHGAAPELDLFPDSAEASFTNVVTGGEESKFRFPLMTPTDGYVTQGFDPSHNHFGMDFAGRRGTPVYAAADGFVVFAGWTTDDGNMIILQHAGGYITVYKHNQALLESAHRQVARGEAIALLGTSGRTSLGPHLHFEVWKDGIPQDPETYLLSPVRGQQPEERDGR
jgi:murein DD-endopeptidase MepM/ murein hydrolase activator NlpD